MPQFDLTDEEQAAIAAALGKLIAEDKFPFSPRLKPLKSALAKLDPGSAVTLLRRPGQRSAMAGMGPTAVEWRSSPHRQLSADSGRSAELD